MILQYFKKKENKEQIIATKQYKKIIYESNIFLNDNNFFIRKDYKTSFEIVSIFLKTKFEGGRHKRRIKKI